MFWNKTLTALAAASLFACGQPSPTPDQPGDTAEQPFSSAEATLLDFEYDAQLTSKTLFSPRSAIDDQMLYTIGHLNTHHAVGRLDKVKISNIVTTAQPDGSTLVTYHVKLPVAWGSKTQLPVSYDFRLPRDMGFDALDAFATNYQATCADSSAHDVSSGNFWYYYRPLKSGCTIPDAELVRLTATVSRSTENTTGKYPEYDRVWSDNVLNVVAIFGKYEADGTTPSDAGIAAYNAFVRSIRSELASLSPVTVPAVIPQNPGVDAPDVSFSATLPGGGSVAVTVLLVDSITSAGPAFNARYEALSTTADVIMYNGHAGLGQNVRALARKGRFVAGKYLIVFMNGCDTFAYVDGSLAQTRAALNPDDPTGTKYMDIVTNAMPAFFSSMPGASMALVRSLMKPQTLATYDQMFRRIDGSQVVVVTGEEDNSFAPTP